MEPDNITEWLEEGAKLRRKMEREIPDLWQGYATMHKAAFSDGALSAKVKHLMGLAVALRAGCGRCILNHTKAAIHAGATKDEIMETLKVGIAMGGSPAIGFAWYLNKYLDEQGML